jgi:alginate O-acetyltransferase complex protein AlgF
MKRFIMVMTVGCLSSTCILAQQAGMAQLYPVAPPVGASFVRFLNPLREAVTVGVSGVEDRQALFAPGALVGSYKMVSPGRSLQLSINGRPIASTTKVEPNTFTTLVIKRSGDEYGLTGLQDATLGHNALKADLRVYNLAEGCTATVMADKELKVFDRLPEGETRRRAINPVAVELTALCGKAESVPWPLPQLAPGTRYSLFVTGDSAKPVLTGKIDVVD